MKKAVRIRRFSSRIRAVVVIVTAVTLLIYNIVCYTSAKKILKEDFFSRSDVIMEKTNERLNDYMDEFAVNIGLMAENDIIRDSLESGEYDWNILPMIQNLTAMDRYTLNVEIYNRNMELFYRANATTVATPDSEMRKIFTSLENSEAPYGSLIVKTDDGYVLTVIRSIHRNGRCLGYVVAYADHGQIVDAYESAGVFINEGDIYIADSNGSVVAAASGSMLDIKWSENSGRLTGGATDKFKQHEMYDARVEKLNMSVLTFVSPHYVMKQLERIVYQNIVVSAIIFIACILGAIELGKSISEPIEDMKRYIEENISE